MEKLYTVSQQRPGTDCGSYPECLITKFRLKLKKVGTITRPLRYDPKKVKVLVTQSCLTLCDSMDCNSPGSSVHGILQARIQDWVPVSFTSGSSWPKDWTWVSPKLQADFYHLNERFREPLPGKGYLGWKPRYDLNKIHFNNAVGMANRFKRLNLIDKVPEELWMEVSNILQKVLIKTIHKRKKKQKGKMVVSGNLTNSSEKKRNERQRRQGYTHLNAENSQER